MAYNHFDYVPSGISKNRSVFKFEKAIATGCEIGYLYPMCKPVAMMPGSSLKLDLAMEVRSGALIAPLQDELILDCFAFNVPNRIVWEHWKQFLGSTDDVLFDNLQEYQIPSFIYGVVTPTVNNSDCWTASHMLACNMELPYVEADEDTQGGNPIKVSALPFRGYNFIWNEFFRPEQLVDPVLFSKTDDGASGDNMTNAIYDGSITIGGVSIEPLTSESGSTDSVNSGGLVLPTFRVHKSLWTSCLPKPSLETLNLLAGLTAPVGIIPTATLTENGSFTPVIDAPAVANKFSQARTYSSVEGVSLRPIIADLNQTLLTVNNYRETIMLQNYYDALNRSGSRYDEIIRNIFHTQTNFGVIDIPELIVHKRFTIYRKDVVATATTSDGDAIIQQLGSQASYIDTVVRDSFFTKSTTEHGYIHLLYTIRSGKIRMSQGIEPDWTQLNKFDMYYPQFDGMGDVPRYKHEVFYDILPNAASNAIFGYQEYGADKKYQRNSATTWADVNLTGHVAGLTLAEKLGGVPSLIANTNFGYFGYISCLVDEDAFACCLAVSNPTVAPQFILDIRLTGEIVHPMPVYNIPGMGDLL